MKICLRSPFHNTGSCWFLERESRWAIDCVVAGRKAREWIYRNFEKEGIGYDENSPICVNIEYLPDPRDLKALGQMDHEVCLFDEHGEGMAWIAEESNPGDCQYVVTAKYPGIKLEHPWHLLDFQQSLLKTFESDYQEGQINPLASIQGVLRLGGNSVILPGVVIEGHAVIGNNCRIGPNCYIRGTTSIGDDCLIGQSVEIKSSIIGDRTCISHLAYVGDSIIGTDVNFGAGTVCSNYRHDGGIHQVMQGRELVSSGRDKLGAMIGNRAKLGCNTTIYPGRIIYADGKTLPGEFVAQNIG